MIDRGNVWRALLLKMTTTSALHEIFTTVRQTAAAHASALNELERDFSDETVTNKSTEEKCPHLHLKKKKTKKKKKKNAFLKKCLTPPYTIGLGDGAPDRRRERLGPGRARARLHRRDCK